MEDVLEVRCAGCDDTLEVERGLTEFACPGCATAQALPPELMPPPPRPRPRRALPLGPAPSTAPPSAARVLCDGCGAVLAVPRGVRRVACPLCGDVAGTRSRLAAHSGVQVVSHPGAVAVAGAATSSARPEEEPITSQTILVGGQVQAGRYNNPIQNQTGVPFPAYSSRREPSSSHRSNTRAAIHVGSAKHTHTSQSLHIEEESRINLLDETDDGNSFRKQHGPPSRHGSLYVNKVRVEQPTKASHAPQSLEVTSSHSVHAEEVRGENQSGRTTGRVGIQKARRDAISSIPEQETADQIACAEQVEVDSCDDRTGRNWKRKRDTRSTTWNHKAKNGGLSSSNEEIHLTCSDHTQPPECARIRNPIQQPALASDGNPCDPADIDRIVARLCPSSLPRKQVSQARSNVLGNNTEQYRARATGSLANQGLSSAQEHAIPEESSNGIGDHHNSSQQVRENPSPGVIHRKHIQGGPSDDSDSQHTQVESLRSQAAQSVGKGSRNESSKKRRGRGPKILIKPRREADRPLLTPSMGNVQAAQSVGKGSENESSKKRRGRGPKILIKPCREADRPLLTPSMGNVQAAQSVGKGSENESSRKRRGRGPTKLIEPRREADRPLLTPNNAGTWDIEPPCTRVIYTMSSLLKKWHPGSTYVPANQQTNEVHKEQLIVHWNDYPPDTRATILDEFLRRYKWAPGQEAVCLKLFERKMARRFISILSDEKRRARIGLERRAKVALDAANASSNLKNLDDEDAGEELKQGCRDPTAVGQEDDDPLQWKPFPPEWIQPKWWEMLCEHWASEEVLQASAQKRKIRYAGGSAQHTAGARSIAMHRKLMIIENGGKPVSDLEVFNKTHKRDGGKGEFVSERAKEIVERFNNRLEEAGDTELDPHVVWVQVGGRKHGRYYGLNGIIDRARIKAMSKSTPGLLDKRTRKKMFTQDQVQEMISHAMQQLNETWEKKFQSLQQKMMHGEVSPKPPEHAPLPCTATPAAEGSTSRQDAADSSHDGTYQSATDDDDEDDEDYVAS